MNFKIVSPAKGWKALISLIKTMSDDSAFTLTQLGIIFKTRDASGHAGIYFLWPKEKLIEYTFETDSPSLELDIGYKVEDFEKMLNRFEKESTLTIKESEKGRLLISSDKKEYEMSLIDAANVKMMPKLNVEYEAGFDTEPKIFKEVLDDLKIVSDRVFFDIKDGKLIFSGHDENHGGKVAFQGQFSQDVSVQYNIDYLLTTISSIINYIDKLKIQFGTNKPISVQMNIPELGEIAYFLAPVVKTE